MKVGPNVTHRADGRWEARYIKGHTSNGRTSYGFCYGKTQEEALHKAEDAKTLLQNSAIDRPKRFRDVYALWLNGVGFFDESVAHKYLLSEIGDCLVTELTDHQLSRLLQSIKTKSNPTDTKKCFDILHSILSYAVNEDYLFVSPIGAKTMRYQSGRKSHITSGTIPITPKEYFSFQQAERFEKQLLNSRKFDVAVGLYICLHLGLTRQEVGALQLKDIDFQNRVLIVHKVLTEDEKRSHNSFTNIEERRIPLPQFVMDFFKEIHGKFSSDESFLASNKSSEYARELERINTEHKIAPRLNLNMLRETFIARCIKNDIDIPTVMKLVGNDNISDFWARYGGLCNLQTEKILRLKSYSEKH